MYVTNTTHRVHLKVDNLASSQSNHNLTLVKGTAYNGLLARSFPLVDSTVRSDVPDAVGVNLHTIIADEILANLYPNMGSCQSNGLTTYTVVWKKITPCQTTLNI